MSHWAVATVTDNDKGKGRKNKRPFFIVFDYEGGGRGVGGNVKRLRSYFYKLCFFRVFQNDPGPPKYALELRDYVKYMFFFLHFTLHYSLELMVQKVKFRGF